MKIDSYKFGGMVIDGQQYTADLIIFADYVKADWWREQGHLLQPEDLVGIDLAKIQKLIVGQGKPGLMKVAKSIKELCEKNQVELISTSSKKAVDIYNSIADKSSAVALFHLTC